MKDDFAAAMRRSLELTRAGDPFAATRTIQEALATSSDTETATGAGPMKAAKTVKSSRRLSQVIAALAQKSKDNGHGQRRGQTVIDVPEGAAFESLTHNGPHGGRDYRLYRPTSKDAPIAGVILMLHGCTQSPEDFAIGTRMNVHAERHGMIVVYPEQTRTQNTSLCWNWFRPGDRCRSGGEAAILADLAAAIAKDHAVPAGRVFAAGLSAGGAMAAILAQTHPEVFAAVGIHSGLAPGSANDVVSAFGAMRGDAAPNAEPLNAPAIIFHGSADRTVAPVNAGRLAGPLEGSVSSAGQASGRRYDVLKARNVAGHPVEVWRVDGAGHAWSGGDSGGSYTDPTGPDASAEMMRFFLGRT